MPRTKLGAGVTRVVTVAGKGGVPAGGAVAVDLLVLGTAATAATNLKVYADGASKPVQGMAFVPRAGTVATTVSVPLSAGGKIRVTNASGSVHVALAVLSWYKEQPSTAPTANGFTSSDARSLGTTAYAANTTRTVAIAGKGGVPATGATAVQLGVHAVAGTRPVSVTVHSATGTRPAIASLNVPASRQRTTTMVVPLGSSGAGLGKVKVVVGGGKASVTLSVRGYHTSAVGASSLRFTPLPPALVADTRLGVGLAKAPLGPARTVTLQVGGRAGVPTQAKAVVLSVQASGATASTQLTAYRDGTARPAPVSLATAVGETVSSRIVVPLSAAGKLKLYNRAGKTHAQLVVEGWYGVNPPPPPPPAALPGSVVAAAKALTTGSSPRQTGVAPGVLDETRVSILTGSVVRSVGNTPVAGAGVRIADRPELGATTTAADGTFAVAVNGGGPLVVEVTATGYLPVQRNNEVPWLVWQQVPDIALTALDPNAAVIDQDNSAVQVVTGSTKTDGAGTRTSTLLFEPGTEATMTLPNGSTAPLGDAMTVRTTEFTTGAQGQDAMPGLLPYNTGYTFAAEYSVDQALAAGATEVSFSNPVNTYVDNFLDLVPGTTVPSGYYDRDLARWVAGPNGLAIDVVGETGGRADLDTGGDAAADPGSYASLSIDDAERTKLAQLYDPGKKLWRVQVEHFTPWDYNYPYGPPAGAGGPPGPGGDGGGDGGSDGGSETKKRPCAAGGSVILCESQTLQEVVDLTGTPLTLRYSSDEVPGRATGRTMRIRVKDGSPVGPLQEIAVTVTVAGRVFEHSLDPATSGDFFSFTWDGLDSSGTRIVGDAVASVTVGYGYEFVYKEPQEFDNAFAQFGEGTLFRRGGSTPASRPETSYIERTFTQTLSSPDARLDGNGGWRFDQVHRYDPERRRVTFGDGRSVSAGDVLSASMSTIAGTGSEAFIPPSGPALETSIGTVRGLAAGPDGSVYFADSTTNVIGRLSPEGVIEVVAGGGDPEDGLGDGGQATSARLEAPWDVAVGADGSVFIADSGDNRIRKVSPEGVISTIAGGGSPSDGIGDGVDARAARLVNPRGIALSTDGELFIADTGHDRVRMLSTDGAILTVAGGGSPADDLGDGLLGTRARLDLPVDVVAVNKAVYIADSGQNRVRVLRVDGTMTTFAGNGGSGAAVDGQPATETPLASPSGVAASADGTIYIADRLHNRVRKVNADGVMLTAAGSGVGTSWWSDQDGDGALPGKASLSAPYGVTVTPSGSLVITDSGNFRIRGAAPALAGSEASAYVIPSTDGSQVFEFGDTGLHLRTRDALTGLPVLTMAYDAAGRLASVTTARGRVHTVQRAPSGVLTGITAATGETTTFGVNADGWLGTVTDNAGEVGSFGYTAGGLMTSYVDRAGGQHLFEYDAQGRLVRDQNPAGGHLQLDGAEIPNGRRVTMTSSTGRQKVVQTTTRPDGVVRRQTTEPNGATVVALIRPDGDLTITDVDGVVTTVENGPDPRWGSLVQVPLRTVVRQPNGDEQVTQIAYDVELASPGQPLSLVRHTQTATSGSDVVTREYVAATRTETVTGVDGVPKVAVFDEYGDTVSVRSGSRPATTFTYDEHGRLKTATVGTGAAAPRTTTYTYVGGALSSLTDPMGRTTTFVSDPLGRVTTVTHPGGVVTGYTFDAEGRRTSVTPAGRPTHLIGVDDGRLASYDAPTGPVPERAYAYDLDGQLASVRGGNGTLTTHTRNAAGQVTSITHPDGTNRTFGYDGHRRVSATNAGGADVAFGFDANSQLQSLDWNGAVDGTVTLTRNADLRVTGVKVGAADPLGYTWTRSGLVRSVAGLDVSFDANELYDGDQAGTVQASLTRTPLGEPARLAYAVGGAEILAQEVLTRDGVGRVLTRSETVGGDSATYGYTYDVRGRLTKVTRDGLQVEAYTYDGNGNRLTATAPGLAGSATYNSRDQVLTQAGATFTHDADGQRATRVSGAGTTTYAWDRFGHLRTVDVAGGAEVGYLTDGLNQRIGRRVDGALTDGYLYDDSRRIVGWTRPDGSVKARFGYAGGGTGPAVMLRDGKTFRMVTDQLGSVRAVVDTASGEVVQELRYDSFGRVLSDSNPGFQPFGFAGGLYDAATGLVHFDARDYDPGTGRWLSLDPIGFDGGDTNLYAYVGNDPVNSADPTGKFGIPGIDLPDIDFPDVDFPDLKMPSLGCLKDLAGTTFDLLSYVPGPIGMAASGAGLALKCASGCSKTDIALGLAGMVPGGKLATKVGGLTKASGKGKKAIDGAGWAKDNVYDAFTDGWGMGALAEEGGGYAADIHSHF